MRKSILIGVLAALMLFAFTACENSASTYKIPVGITAEASNTEYLVGEYTDPSTITATVRFSDGSTQAFTGTQLGIPAQKTTSTEPVVTVPVAYGASYSVSGDKIEATGGVGTYVNLYVYSVDSATISNLPATAAYDGKVDTTGVAVTVTYNHGKTRTLTADEFTFTASTSSTAGTQNATVTTKELKVFGTVVNTLTGLDDWKVNVDKSATAEYNAEKYSYTELVITGPDKEEIVIKSTDDNKTATNLAGYIGDEFTFAFNLVSEDDGKIGKKAAVLNTDYFFVDGVAPTGNKVELTAKGESEETEAATYEIKFAKDVSKAFTVNAGWGEDYATGKITITPSTVEASKPDTTVGAETQLSNYVFEIELASGEKETVTTGSSEYCEIELLDPIVSGTKYNPRFEISYGTVNEDEEYTTTKLFYLESPITTTPAGDNAEGGEN